MKKIVRLVVFSLALAGTIAGFAGSSLAAGNGDPVPLCDPDNPSCTILPPK